jgi:cytochrome c553
MVEKLFSLPGIDARVAATLLLVMSAATSVSAIADQDDGAQLAFKYHCTTCHGQNGVASSDRYPNLAGQSVAYLVSRLKYFRDGLERGNQMNSQAAPLSDEEIEQLAAYFNSPT